MTHFSPEEAERIRAFYRKASRRRRTKSLEQDLLAWALLIGQLESGYAGEWNSYISYLDRRMGISRLIWSLPEPTRAKVSDMVRPLDERFFQSTQEAIKTLPWANDYGDEPWRNRVPKNFVETDFIEYLSKNGYL